MDSQFGSPRDWTSRWEQALSCAVKCPEHSLHGQLAQAEPVQGDPQPWRTAWRLTRSYPLPRCPACPPLCSPPRAWGTLGTSQWQGLATKDLPASLEGASQDQKGPGPRRWPQQLTPPHELPAQLSPPAPGPVGAGSARGSWVSQPGQAVQVSQAIRESSIRDGRGRRPRANLRQPARKSLCPVRLPGQTSGHQPLSCHVAHLPRPYSLLCTPRTQVQGLAALSSP